MAEEFGAGLGADDRTADGMVISRSFRAQRARVWKAWTEAEWVRRWWGPRNFTSPDCRIDLRVGGKYLFCMRAPDGQDFWSAGTYLEIVPQRRIVCTDSFCDEKGNPVPPAAYGMDGDWPPELTITVTLEDQGDSALLTLVHEGIPEGTMRDLSAAGWREALDKLDAILR